jgi:Flp pilus assembly protein TadG
MRSPRRGANAVEFALILPVLLVFTFGVMDIGWISFVRHAASSAAGAGARAGALTMQAADPNAIAVEVANERWAELGLPATPVVTATQVGDPSLMVVDVEVDLDALVGFVVGSHTIAVTAVKRMEDQP